MSTELAKDPITCTLLVTNGAFTALPEAECSLSLK